MRAKVPQLPYDNPSVVFLSSLSDLRRRVTSTYGGPLTSSHQIPAVMSVF